MNQNRLQGAITEYDRTPGSRILVHGGFGHFNATSESAATHATRYLVDHGVPEAHIYQNHDTAGTVEEGLSAFRFSKTHQVNKVCIVTSDVHLERSRIVFEHFFEPSRLRGVGTPNGISDDELPDWVAHEERGLALLKNQGGIKLEGRLFPKQDWTS